jgi:hypothetical protein
VVPIPGYSNRIIRIPFPDLSDDPENDPIWVAIRNPRLVPPAELTPDHVTGITDGVPDDMDAANNATYKIMSRLIVGWRAYDASRPVQLNAVGEDVTPQVLLPASPESFTPPNVAKLPMEIVQAIGKEMTDAMNPR